MKWILTVVLLGFLVVPGAWAQQSAAKNAEDALGLTREERQQIQQSLTVEGFDARPANGEFGPRTRKAIRDWQAGRNADATGYLTERQARALGRKATRPSEWWGQAGEALLDRPESDRLAEWRRQAEAKRREDERRQAEAKRREDERQAEAKRREDERQAEANGREDERRQAEAKRREDERRQAEAKRRRDERRQADAPKGVSDCEAAIKLLEDLDERHNAAVQLVESDWTNENVEAANAIARKISALVNAHPNC